MRYLYIIVALGLLPATDTYAEKAVRGYTRKDGTYVAPHRRADANQTQRDNWSSKPNENPYTGKPGNREPRK
jgi:hypothetical protein